MTTSCPQGAPRLLAAWISTACLAVAASAQQPHRDTVPATRPDRLPAVHVTVLRTPFDVTTAPLSVASVAPVDVAAARPGFSLDEALGQVAGIQVDNRLNFALGERISVRGIGARSQFGTRGIRVITDGIPQTLADGQSALNNIDLGSLGLAEAIRGPASALYGNASAGVISLNTVPPPPIPFAPTARLMAGSDGLTRFQVGGAGMKGRGTYVVNGDRLDYAGYRAFSRARNAHFNSIGTWDWDRAAVKVVLNAVQYEARNPGSLSDSLIALGRHNAYGNNVKQQTGERGKQNQVGLSGHAVLGPGELRLFVYGLTRAINNPIPTSIIGIHRAAGGARAAYAVSAGVAERSISAIVGGETDLQRDDRRNWVNLSGLPGALSLDQRERVTSASAFTQLSASLGSASFLAGGRYDRYRFAAQDHLITATNPDDSGVRNMSSVNPTLGATYEAAPWFVPYANFATGFQTPTTTELVNRPNGAGGFNPDLQPERTHSHEAGVRGRSGFVAYDVTAYDMRIDNELIAFEVPSVAGRQFYRNAGIARHRGIDADATTEPIRNVRVHATYTFTNARYVTYAVASGSTTRSYAGNRVPGIAPSLASLSLELGEPVSRFLSIEGRYRSAIPVNDANTALSRASIVTNLRGTMTFARQAAVFGGIGNLFGEVYNTSVSINATGGRYFDPAAGRSFYAGVDLGIRR